VEKAIRAAFSGKHGPYGQYGLNVRAEMGKYTCHAIWKKPSASSEETF